MFSIFKVQTIPFELFLFSFFPLSFFPPLFKVQTIVSDAAKTCMPSEHTESLAKPKERPDGPFRDPEWKVSPATMQATASDRVMELSKPKKLADGYQPCRDVVWKVGVGARNAVASNR